MALLVLACERPLPDLKLLEGYWSIEYVTYKKEKFIPKAATVLLDYYAVEAKKGFRKKITPELGNRMRASEDSSPFQISVSEDHYVLNFNTRWDQWEEKILKLTSEQLVIVHQEKHYHYKKQFPTVNE